MDKGINRMAMYQKLPGIKRLTLKGLACYNKSKCSSSYTVKEKPRNGFLPHWSKMQERYTLSQFCCCIGINISAPVTLNHLQLLTEIFLLFKFTFRGVGDANHQVLREENRGNKNLWCAPLTCVGLTSNEWPLCCGAGSVQECSSPALKWSDEIACPKMLLFNFWWNKHLISTSVEIK